MQKQETVIPRETKSQISSQEILTHGAFITSIIAFPLEMFYVLTLITLLDLSVDIVKENVEPEKLPKIPPSIQKIYEFAGNYTLTNMGSKLLDAYNFFTHNSTTSKEKQNGGDKSHKTMNKNLYDIAFKK